MKITINVEGMSCMHCVASVKGALEKLNGVTAVQVELERKTADVEYDDTAVSAEDMINAIEDIGFGAGL